MIKNALDNVARFKEIISQSGFLGQKIFADYASGQSEETNSFYLSENCAFMLSGVNITLCGVPTADELEEILLFCNFCKIKNMECQLNTIPLEKEKLLHIMEFGKTVEHTDDEVVTNKDVYSFIRFCCGIFHGINFDIVYGNFSRKINSRIADIHYIKRDNKIVSGAIATKYGEDTMYITFVCTDSQYRRQGLAQQVIKHIAADNSGKKIILKCEDGLKNFYENMGFKEVGTINLYKI